MIKKLVINKLIDWKNSKEKLPIILRRARQVGKTTLFSKHSFCKASHVSGGKSNVNLPF